METTLKALIASHSGNLPAIGAPGRDCLTYEGLRNLTREVAEALNEMGIDAAGRVAIVLPNGPEMASAFITVAQAATTAAAMMLTMFRIGNAISEFSLSFGTGIPFSNTDGKIAHWKLHPPPHPCQDLQSHPCGSE